VEGLCIRKEEEEKENLGKPVKGIYPEYLLLWRYSRPPWTRSCAACSG